MIDVEVTQPVISSVTGRTGNWAYRTTMSLEAVPRAGDQLVWGTPGHEICDQVLRVSHYEARLRSSVQPGVSIDLVPEKTDSPDFLNQLMELHKDWEQLGGPWEGQDDEPADRH